MEQKAKEAASHAAIPVSISAMLVTLGVVYGDIGTSPMYVTKALVAGNGGIGSVTEEFVLGALSLVVWTVTLLTTTARAVSLPCTAWSSVAASGLSSPPCWVAPRCSPTAS